MSRLLTLDDSGAFKITGAVADIDDLKKVLTSNSFETGNDSE